MRWGAIESAVHAATEMKRALDQNRTRNQSFEKAWARQWGGVELEGLVAKKELRQCKDRLSKTLAKRYFPTLVREYLHYASVRRTTADDPTIKHNRDHGHHADEDSRLFVGLSLEGWMSFVTELSQVVPKPPPTAGADEAEAPLADTAQIDLAEARRLFTSVNVRHDRILKDAIVTRLFHGDSSVDDTSDATQMAGDASSYTLWAAVTRTRVQPAYCDCARPMDV